MKPPRIVFGPVNSRRLGRSLGVDLVPRKTCSFNCVYCECGSTNRFSVVREEFYPLTLVTSGIKTAVDELDIVGTPIDFVTFSGGGEPTLYSRLGEVIDYLKDNYPNLKICLLTNGSLLFKPDLQRELFRVDLIVPSLNAVTKNNFSTINRHHPDLEVSTIIRGIVDFSHNPNFKGEVWIEVFVVPGVNDNVDEILLLKEVLSRVRIKKIQLNVLDRPGSEDWIRTPKPGELARFTEILAPLPVEIVPNRSDSHLNNLLGLANQGTIEIAEIILSTIARRPSTLQELATLTKVEQGILEKKLRELESRGMAVIETNNRGEFWKLKTN